MTTAIFLVPNQGDSKDHFLNVARDIKKTSVLIPLFLNLIGTGTLKAGLQLLRLMEFHQISAKTFGNQSR